jgi:hypothetical protein
VLQPTTINLRSNPYGRPILGDKTPREAIQTPEGLEQVKFLLDAYEHGEAQKAKAQQRAPVSYDFLWQSVGITP